MKKIRVEEAVGSVLAHDITRIVAGETKEVGFRKGHVVKDNDIPELIKLGKRNLFILKLSENELHENEAAFRIARSISGDNLKLTQPVEGKINVMSSCDGLLKIDFERLLQINRLDDVIVATLKTLTPCRAGQVVAATRIIPLTIDSKKIEKIVDISASDPLVKVKPYRKLRVGCVVTGSEILEGLVKDGSDEFVISKARKMGCEIVKKHVVSDDSYAISMAISDLKSNGCELILATGGLSIDPDDVTRIGVKNSGAEIINYGCPVLPGSMVLYARLDGIHILGLPACVYYHQTTVYDLILPLILADEPVTRDYFASMGHGGLCLQCSVCRFPDCSFGR